MLKESRPLPVTKSFKDLNHGVSNGVNDLMVMVIESHFNIQTHKLRQMAMSVGILSPEHLKKHRQLWDSHSQ